MQQQAGHEVTTQSDLEGNRHFKMVSEGARRLSRSRPIIGAARIGRNVNNPTAPDSAATCKYRLCG